MYIKIKILAGDYYVADNVGVTSVTLGYETTEVAMTLESGDVQNCCAES
jgi:hypothetical protein